jgi:hypothetical protein
MRYPSWGRGDARKQGELKMERRKFLIGAGSAAIGSSALIGSGAFSNMEANREFDIAVAGDENAFLRLSASSDTDYVAETNKDIIKFYFGDEADSQGDISGTGLNNRAGTEVNDAFTIENQSDRELYVWMPGPNPTSPGAQSVEFVANDTDITFPEDASKDIPTQSLDVTDTTGAITLGTGDTASVDLRFLVWGSSGARDFPNAELQFKAIQTDGNSKPKDKDAWTTNDISESTPVDR